MSTLVDEPAVTGGVLTDRQRWLIREDIPVTASSLTDLPKYLEHGQRAEVVHYAAQLQAMIATLDAIGWTSHDAFGPVTDDVREFARASIVGLRGAIADSERDSAQDARDRETIAAFAKLATAERLEVIREFPAGASS